MRRLVLLAALAVVVSGCGSAAATIAPSRPCLGEPSAAIRHVVWVVMENHSYGQIVGSSSAPYLNRLAAECGLATNYSGVAHPSLPNYLAMTSGSTQGVTDDGSPGSHPLGAASIFSQLGSGGWRSLEESMPTSCDLSDAYPYAVKHNPAAYFTGIRAACALRDVPLSFHFSARLTFVTPNLCNDTHDCSVATGDSWLSRFVARLIRSRYYQARSTAVFITWDEDDGSSGNHVPTLVVAPGVPPGARPSAAFNHYGLLRTTEELLGLPCLANACSAVSMRSAFGL